MEPFRIGLLGLSLQAWITLIFASAVVALASAVALRRLQRRYTSVYLLRRLEDGVRGTLIVDELSAGGHFHAHFSPPPEPFTTFEVRRQSNSVGGRRRQIDRLRLTGTLDAAPIQELLWRSGQIEGRALQRGAGTDLWIQHRLDITQSEYLTRGDTVAALEHLLFELHRRFAPNLLQFTVQRADAPHVVVELELNRGLNPEELSRLVDFVRGAGRAARIR